MTDSNRKPRISELVLLIFVLALCNKRLCWCQIETELPNQSTINPLIKPLRICNDNDSISNTYCSCSNEVVSCDFSEYPLDKNLTEFSVYGFRFPTTASRFCLCNAPPNVHLKFEQNHFLPFSPKNAFHRFDLFNLTGVVHLDGGFSENFNGDLYIANVTNIPEIKAYEFGRGADNVKNVQDLKCCSPIKVDQEHNKPVLFIENSTINSIAAHGLENSHLWKTIILKSLFVRNVYKYGIFIQADTPGLNVAILKSTFENMTRHAILFEHSENVLLVKNDFTETARYDAIGSRSTYNNSNVVLMDNTFWNSPYLEFDARRMVFWFNIFNVWDNVTFIPMKNTVFHDRSISLKYNLVNWELLHEKSVDFGNGSNVIIAENVLGTCNCSTFILEDKSIKPEINRCYTGDIRQRYGTASEQCSLRWDAVRDECRKSSNNAPDFIKMCKNKEIAIPSFPGVGTDLKGDVNEAHIKSDFVNRIVAEFRSTFGVNKISKLEGILSTPADQDQNDENSGHTGNSPSTGVGTDKPSAGAPHGGPSHNIRGGSVAVPLFVSFGVILILSVAAFVVYRHRHRFLHSRIFHQPLQGSREVFI